jgi:putative hydrolase of the HAD superfamily
MRDIRAITLDVGGTLIQPWPSVGHVYAEVAADHGCGPVDPAILNSRFIEAWRSRRDFEHSHQGWSKLVDATFVGLVDRRPSESFFPALYERFADPAAWKIHDDVPPALDELASRGLPMAAVSNWDERLRPLLKALNLDGYFEAVLVSCELYFAKPSNVIFEHALRKLGVAPGDALHVGDSELEDMEGARGAGMQAMLIDRSKPTVEGRIQSLTELLDLVPVQL